MPHVFVDDLDALELADDDRHHLERVLRVRPGDPLTVSDGAGRWRPCRFGGRIEPVGDIAAVERPAPGLTVCVALVKGERPEWAVQKLTEVGVDRIVPFVAARSVVRWDDEKATRNVGRLRRVAREAAMQSRRVWLPEVAPVATFAEVRELDGVALADPAGRPPSLEHPAVAVGPEGGWAEEELAAGLPTVALGPHILRTETAAVVAGTLLAALRAGLVSATRSEKPTQGG